MERTSTARSLPVILMAIVLGGLIIVLALPGRELVRGEPTPQPGQATIRTISVSGEGRVTVTPDRASIEIGVIAQRPTVKEVQEAAAAAMQKVVASLKANGIPDDKIQTRMLSLQPQYEYKPTGGEQKIVGYQLTNIVAVKVDKLDRIGPVVDDAMSAGATSISSIGFTVADPEKPAQQARALAVGNARTHADALASAAGVRVGSVFSITETSSITPPPVVYAGEKEAAGTSTPILPGTTEVVVTVNVVYEIGS